MIFRYPGAKTKYLPILTPLLFPLVEKTNSFTDAFVGGGSVLCAVAERFRDLELRANDLNDYVYSFWQYVATTKSTEDLKERLRQPVTVKRFVEMRETPPTSLVDKAYYAVFFNRTTFSGIETSGPIGGLGQKSKWTIDCRYNTKKLTEGVDKLHRLLGGRLTVSNTSTEYLDVEGGATYLDPPYYVKGEMLYRCYMEHAQHEALAQKLRTQDNWVLSYDDCPEVRQLYGWANVESLSARYSINGKKTAWASKKELVISPALGYKRSNKEIAA
jgi:DNA adenine methylase